MRWRTSALWWRVQRYGAPYAFMAPFVVLFSVFMVYPLFNSVWMAFRVTSGPHSSAYVGLANFQFMVEDPNFWMALKNTSEFAFFSVFLQLPLSLGLALLLNNRWLRGRNAFRLAFFSPQLVGQVFVALLFQLIFIPRFGLLNQALHAAAGTPIDTDWLSNPRLVMPALVLTSLWMYAGLNVIYFLAALQNVEQTLHEAAMVDGAGSLRRFWHITLPSIKPVTVFVVLMSTIGSFQLFELPYVLFRGGAGPNNAGLTVVMYLYQTGFSTGDLGYASAIGWALVIIIAVISLVQAHLTGLWRQSDL